MKSKPVNPKFLSDEHCAIGSRKCGECGKEEWIFPWTTEYERTRVNCSSCRDKATLAWPTAILAASKAERILKESCDAQTHLFGH